mgnify:CR=1 FL=1
MTKYQDALNLLKSWAKKDRNAYSPKHLKNINDRANVLQELVDKATPKKIEMMRIKKYDGNNVGICICGEAIDDSLNEGLKFCPYCGQAIDWRIDE